MDVPAGPRRGGELGRGIGELGEEGVLAVGELPYDRHRASVPDERHVGGEDALPSHQVLVVAVVEQVGVTTSRSCGRFCLRVQLAVSLFPNASLLSARSSKNLQWALLTLVENEPKAAGLFDL